MLHASVSFTRGQVAWQIQLKESSIGACIVAGRFARVGPAWRSSLGSLRGGSLEQRNGHPTAGLEINAAEQLHFVVRSCPLEEYTTLAPRLGRARERTGWGRKERARLAGRSVASLLTRRCVIAHVVPRGATAWEPGAIGRAGPGSGCPCSSGHDRRTSAELDAPRSRWWGGSL